MTIKVFVDWFEREIVNEAGYKERIRQETEKIMAYEEDFFDWLGENYSPQEIWGLTEAGRIEIQGFWERKCKDTAEDESGFEMIEIEI